MNRAISHLNQRGSYETVLKMHELK